MCLSARRDCLIGRIGIAVELVAEDQVVGVEFADGGDLHLVAAVDDPVEKLEIVLHLPGILIVFRRALVLFVQQIVEAGERQYRRPC